jgi:hypothetical protein
VGGRDVAVISVSIVVVVGVAVDSVVVVAVATVPPLTVTVTLAFLSSSLVNNERTMTVFVTGVPLVTLPIATSRATAATCPSLGVNVHSRVCTSTVHVPPMTLRTLGESISAGSTSVSSTSNTCVMLCVTSM